MVACEPQPPERRRETHAKSISEIERLLGETARRAAHARGLVAGLFGARPKVEQLVFARRVHRAGGGGARQAPEGAASG